MEIMDKSSNVLILDGETLTTTKLVSLQNFRARIALSPDARERVLASRNVVDEIMATGEVVYGINTGFGLFSNVTISDDQLGELQTNLIRSHSAGVGVLLSPQRTRMLLALRINVLAKGHSGISIKVVDQMIEAFNAGCLSAVPYKGTVGASGDLAPLSHLALGLLGEGKMWDPSTNFQSVTSAASVLSAQGLSPIVLGPKEGLAMINGTQLIASLGSEAVERTRNVARCADIACALTLEVLFGTVRAYHPLIHNSRPHAGQQMVASRIRALLQPDEPSELWNSHQYAGKVQDAYSLRCAPQVHGIVLDTLEFVQKVLNTELNSATDNPMVFTKEQVENGEPMGFVFTSPDLSIEEEEPSTSLSRNSPKKDDTNNQKPEDASDITNLGDAKKEIQELRAQLAEQKANSTQLKNVSDTKFSTSGGSMIISGGNFHGEYPAKVLDYLAIAVHELAAISERRIERMCNPTLSGLPAFLVKEGGLNSGFMIAHCTAAACVSENKVLTHPASVDSISTSAAKEDHVSMGGFAARKALDVVENVEVVIAIELLAACQALDLLRPLKTTRALEAVYATVRAEVPPWDKDREMSPDIEATLVMLRRGDIWRAVKPYLPQPTSGNGY